MGQNSKIEWTDHTWNPWYGCRKVSAGCNNCYMYREQKHYGRDPSIVQCSKTTFIDPMKWANQLKSTGNAERVFTCSWSDFFIEEADPWRDEAWNIIRKTPELTYQILTKRPESITDRLPEDWEKGWNHVWLGVSAEDQKTADERIPLLLQTPAAVRFVSCEPLLGPINFGDHMSRYREIGTELFPMLNWVIVGGESGPGARPMHPDWVRSIRDQCVQAEVPFFFKQFGEWLPVDTTTWLNLVNNMPKGQYETQWMDEHIMVQRVGKKAAGRLLDGKEWDEFPE